MSILTIEKIDDTAVDVEFNNDLFIVHLADGRIVSVPIEWFPCLRDATKKQLENWKLIGSGIGIHWPEIDEDISVAGLLKHS